MAMALAPAGALAQSTGSGGSEILEEIIVTAQKRAERLQDVPVPVTAMTSDALLEQNQVRAQDFFSSVPGLNLQVINSRSNLAIRGITTGPGTGNPVVGYTIDDVPYGSSAGLAGLFGNAPDIDPSELARIEVLRGPQGTLYGAASIGGLVKYVTIDPSTVDFRGSIAAGTEKVHHGGDLGYNLRGAVNIPLSDTLAVRASAFTRENPGYINNVTTGERKVNLSRVSGARLSAKWNPSEILSVKLGALYQDRKIFGTSDVDTQLGSRYLQSNTFNSGRSASTNELYSAIINLKLGDADVTSLTSYLRNTNNDHHDTSATGLKGALPSIYPVGIDPFATILKQSYKTKKFAQELRVSMPVGDYVNWVVGGFYTHENTPYSLTAEATGPANGRVYGVPIRWRDSIDFTEYAAFTDITVDLSDRVDVQIGGRQSESRQNLHHRQWTVFDPPGTNGVFSDPKSRDQALTFLVTPRFKISRDHMAYSRVATGYRPGGPNALCDDVTIPCQYKPDKTVNYEIGAKGSLFDQALSYDLSAFYIDWNDLQVVQLVPAGTNNYSANASRARSQGVEASFEARPTSELTLSLWGTYTDATLRQGFSNLVAVYGAKGDQLPYSSRYSGRFSIKQEFSLATDVTGFVSGSVSYVGARRAEFVSTQAEAPLRQRYPAYTQGDLNAGVQMDGIRVNVFLQNVTNTRGLTGGGYNNQTNFNPRWVNYTQPRTIGVMVEKTF